VDSSIFENLFVLEAANNHWGDINRGVKIVREHGAVVRHNGVRAAIKFQFRDVDKFIHKDFSGSKDIRYIHKTEVTKMSEDNFEKLVQETKAVGCLPMATPFDEKSVELCVKLEMPIIKIASSDINSWPLLEQVAKTKKPVIVSTGGADEKQIDDVVKFFANRGNPLAVNHCVSLYPSEDSDLELNQIEYLKRRYPKNVIGFSTHEYHSWEASMFISHAKGARTWERHVDISTPDKEVSPYCSVPEQVDVWFKAFHKAREMSGGSANERRVIGTKETQYLDALLRGVYVRRPLPAGHILHHETFAQDFYHAIPLLKGQLSVREVLTGTKLLQAVDAHEPLMIESVDSPYGQNPRLKEIIDQRGL
jgi:N-acetylneuraminate synthase